MNKSVRTIKKFAPTALSILSVVGTISTAILASKASPKALKLIEDVQNVKEDEITIIEKIKIAAPVYTPTVVTGLATIVCILGSNLLNKRYQAGLCSAYLLLDQTYKEYKNKLIELHGEDTHKEIIDAIAIEKAKDIHITTYDLMSSSCLDADDDAEQPVLFYDAYSKRYFEKKLSKVIQAEYHTNRNFMLSSGSISLNEFYEFLGLEPIPGGDELLWIICDYLTWIDFNHRKVTLEDGLECYVLEFAYDPILEKEYEEAGYL